jgi:hypothetical protein
MILVRQQGIKEVKLQKILRNLSICDGVKVRRSLAGEKEL